MTVDKRRTDACLKACKGISTQNLEDNVPFLELARRYNVVLRERDALRAKLAEMEQQEPVEWQCRSRPSWGDRQWSNWKSCSPGYAQDITKSPTLHDWQYEARPLYALPGAQGEEK